jgi:hypothetical protein
MRALSSNLPVERRNKGRRWLNRTLFGVGLASLFSDSSHEIATTLMPAFLASMGVTAPWLGLIEGVSDRLVEFRQNGIWLLAVRLRQRKKKGRGNLSHFR